MSPAEIAAGLTKAQREAVLSAYDLGPNMAIIAFGHHRSARALYQHGLTHLGWHPSGLTPLGFAVRAILKEQQP